MDAPSAVVVCDACCLSCTFPASWGARSYRGRMAVYSQQPTFSGAPWFPGVHSAWWRPKRTADKSSAAPCVVLHLYSCPCWLLRGQQGKPWMHQAQLWFVMRAACRALSLQVGVHVPIEDAWLCISQQPTFSGAPWFPGVHSLGGVKTNCRQVECCSLCCAASIFLPLLVATWLAGQTMDAPSAVVVCDACCLSCTFPTSWGCTEKVGC